MTTENVGPLNILDPITRRKLKNLRGNDKWSFLKLCLSARGMSVIIACAVIVVLTLAKWNFVLCSKGYIILGINKK